MPAAEARGDLRAQPAPAKRCQPTARKGRETAPANGGEPGIREGVVEALKNRRCFGTTGDKIFVDLTVNGAWGCDDAPIGRRAQEISFEVEAVQPIKKIEILRNSKVIKVIEPKGNPFDYKGDFSDESSDFQEVTYYYLRVTQDNNHIAWSSPVWLA